MSKVSKTARASMGGAMKEVKVVPDSELLQQYREGRAAKLWPSLSSSDAVLRLHDVAIGSVAELTTQLRMTALQLSAAEQALEHFKRELTLANSIIESKDKALADIAAVSGIDSASVNVLRAEPGLEPEQGQDSIGG
jgi:hypothetical protein